jgi:hypothetical protein
MPRPLRSENETMLWMIGASCALLIATMAFFAVLLPGR